MTKEEYFEERERLCKSLDEKDLSLTEFCKKLSDLVSHFNPGWKPQLSEQGSLLGQSMMKYGKGGA